MRNRKKSIVVTGAAIMLAAIMVLGGGTYAYLQDSTKDVVNNFHTNKVLVELKETTGNDYEIIPGTTQSKDPTVTVDNTVDSYVYVEITDATDGLVDYTIADGWTKLDGYDNIYYREVAANAETKTFSVLAGDSVTYDAALENSDMAKDDVALTFKAHAIQSKPFENAASAYLYIDADYIASTPSELEAAIENAKDGDVVVLANDITLAKANGASSAKPIAVENKDITINLNGKTITNSDNIYAGNNWSVFSVKQGGNLTITGNGTVKTKENDCYVVDVQDGSKCTIENGTFIGNISVAYIYQGELTVQGGTFSLQQLSSSKDERFTLNCYDTNRLNGTAKITVTGGTFKNFNPADNEAEGAHTNFVPEGYTITSNPDGGATWYTVQQK